MVGGIAAVVLIAGGIMAWRLTAGPVSLGVLTPLVELAVNTISEPMRVAIEDVGLDWDRSNGLLHVRLVKTQATSSNDEVVLNVPELSVALVADALLRGEVAPTAIDVVRPDLKVVRSAEDRAEMKLSENDDSASSLLSGVMSVLADMTDPKSPGQELREIRIEQGSLNVQDRRTGLSWRGKLENTRVWRNAPGLNAASYLAVTSEGQHSELAIEAAYNSNEAKLSGGLSFGQIRPAMLAAFGSTLDGLATIDLPVHGTLGLVAGGDGKIEKIEKIDFDILGDAGHLVLPVALAQELGIPGAAQRLAVSGVQLNGTYEAQGAVINIHRLSINVEPGQAVKLPAPVSHEMPLSAIRAQGQYRGDDKSAKLESLVLDLDGPSIVINAAAHGIGTQGGLKATAEIVANDIQTNDFPKYWPSSLGTNAYEWCTEHLSDGGISEARIELTATENADGIDIASLSGRMDIKGVTVDYLPPMPKARNAFGVGEFDLNSLTVTIAGAEAAGVAVRGGTAKLYDFDKSQEKADIDLSIAGPIPKILELIDHPPLEYAKAMALEPAETRGSASGRMRLQFPLMVDLPIDQLRVSAQAKLENIFIAKIALGANVTGGTLTLDLDEKGMDVNGPIVVVTTPAKIVWRENFDTGAPFDTRLVVDIDQARISILKQLQLQAVPILEEHIKGPIGVHVEYVAYPSGRDTVAIKTDAKQTTISLPYFDWHKPEGQPGTGEFMATLQNQRLTEISSFTLKSQGLDIQGDARYKAGGQLERIKFSRILVGRTNVEGTLATLPGGGWAIDADGKSLNLGPLMNELEQPGTDAKPVSLGQAPLSVTAKIDTVLIDPKHPLKQVSASIMREDNLWSLVKLDAQVGKGAPLSLSITPGKSRSRSLQVRSSSAGATLRSLGIYKHMIGGKLKINGSFNDMVAGNPLNGKVKITDYRITNAPGMAKVLSVMALTGILDQMKGKGIGFSLFDAPFTLHNGVLDIKDARASGTELGMTAEGRVANETINLKGTIVPFYAVNSVLGKIPLVGPLFSGGEKGGGLLAARYSITGPMDDPSVSVNPLSMLTPGFLRNLFNVFDSNSGSGGSGTGKAPPIEAQPDHP